MAWECVLDCRERSLQALWEEDRVPLSSVAALDLGDVAFLDASGATRLILERKTNADLAASIQDGRWAEQKTRILSNRNGAHVVYVIEGPSCADHDPRWITCVLSAQLFDGFAVISSPNLKGTFEVVAKLWAKMTDPDGEWGVPPAPVPISCLPVGRAKKKSDNYTPLEIWTSQLACIPRVSLEMAAKIVEVYPTLSDLQERATVADLAAIPIKKRKVGPKVAQAIYVAFALAQPSGKAFGLRPREPAIASVEEKEEVVEEEKKKKKINKKKVKEAEACPF
jgi:ERCC4-type nuclease